MPIVNRALVKAGFRNIKSIVTTFDSGGDSGRMRTDERGGLLAFSDYWRSLISLWDDGKQRGDWEEMLRFRDGRGRSFGNIFFQFMAEKSGSLSNVDNLFSKLTGANLCGEVIPVSLSPAEACFTTISGKTYKGEHNLDDLRMSLDKVKKIWLEPKVVANRAAVEALLEADVVIVSPGSVYGSILINFLPKGLTEAYRRTKAKRILLANIMSVANESDDYLELFEKELGRDCFDTVIVGDLGVFGKNLLKKIFTLYSLEHSKPIEIKSDSRIVVADIVGLDKKNLRLRHNDDKLAKMFAKMDLCRRKGKRKRGKLKV